LLWPDENESFGVDFSSTLSKYENERKVGDLAMGTEEWKLRKNGSGSNIMTVN